jgi:pimeloyl-ACP methyl ester carboxylesterase
MSKASLLVLIHGALMDRRSMLALTPMLPNHHAVICPDLAGHGQRLNEHEHLTELNPRGLAADLLDRLPIQSLAATLPVHLVGHSLGALVAIELQQLLQQIGFGAATLVLGDPPLFLNLDTPSQHAAAAGMAIDPVGQRLAHDSFFGFTPNNPSSGKQSLYLQMLKDVSQQLPTHLMHGLLPQHQRQDGGVDCGTFLSNASLLELGSVCKNVFTHPIHDSGHFVFHTAVGLQKLAECLEANDSSDQNIVRIPS